METSVFQIELKDGRIFRIFCANSTQKMKVVQNFHKLRDKAKSISTITNGVHTTKQWNEIVKYL